MCYTIVFLVVSMNVISYKNLYNRQLDYMVSLLDHQAQIIGLSIDDANNSFLSDLNKISFMDDLAQFFTEDDKQRNAIDNIKLFYSEYEDFVTGIKIYDDNRNEFSLRKEEESGEWLQQQFVLHVQGEIKPMERMDFENNKYVYYLPVIKDNKAIANVAVTIDYSKYFGSVFDVFDMEDYEWQWVIDETGNIIYTNAVAQVEYERIKSITDALSEGTIGNLRHNAIIDGDQKRLISSYYSTQLLSRDLAIIFSSPSQAFHSYIVLNSFIVAGITILLFLLVIYIFTLYNKQQRAENEKHISSEKMLFEMIDEMPVGIIIYDSERKVLKANNIAASYYSYQNEGEMLGTFFPEMDFQDVPDYFSKYLGMVLSPDQLVVIEKDNNELILLKDEIPVTFKGVKATLEILNNVTPLETSRRNEAEANTSKAEFISRINFELRGPLNGIIGMTDLLGRYELSDEVKNIVYLLRQSSEHFMRVLNEILDFSKIQTGKMVLNVVPFNIKEEIDFLVDYTKALIDVKDGLVFKYDIDKRIPQKIISDPIRLRQAFTLLMNLSVKNTENGIISFSCKLAEISNGLVTIFFEIQDNGKSFSKEELEDMFYDPVVKDFRAIDKSIDSLFSNILARQLVEKLGGEFKVTSPSGMDRDKGIKICFSIVAFSHERIEKHFNGKEYTSMDEIKTLVLKNPLSRDEDTIGQLHKLGLNLSVTTYNNNTIGQIKANVKRVEGKYDLIVIFDDETLSGFDVAKTIWDNELSSEFILLMISSNDQQGNYLKCVSLGVDHYLSKPFDDVKLEATIRECFPSLEKYLTYKNIVDNSNIKVLIVEDNKINQDVLGTILGKIGCEYDTANDGEEAYIKALEKRYDIILMDLFMPGMNGFDSAKKILANDKTVIIIAISADDMPEANRRAEAAGMRGFISKPVRYDDIESLFDKYFREQ